MPCARSLSLIFSDDGRFDYLRFAFVSADLLCCMRLALTLNAWCYCRHVTIAIFYFCVANLPYRLFTANLLKTINFHNYFIINYLIQYHFAFLWCYRQVYFTQAQSRRTQHLTTLCNLSHSPTLTYGGLPGLVNVDS